jgi:hypothetical protein
MEKIYATRLINHRRVPVMVYETDCPLVEIQPGQDFTVESRNPATMYARWSEVVWKADGTVGFLARSNFTEPDRGRWTIRLLNKDGGDGQKGPDGQIVPIETRTIGGKLLLLPKGVPVLVGLKLDDPLVRFKSMTIVKKRIPVKDPEKEGYLIFEVVTKDETELRDVSELKVLEKLLIEKGFRT